MNRLVCILLACAMSLTGCHAPSNDDRVGSYTPEILQNGPLSGFQGSHLGAGVSVFDGVDKGEEPVGACVIVDAGTSSTIYIETPSFAPGEVCDIDALIDFTPPGTSTTVGGATGKVKREILGTWNGSACITPDGGIYDHATYADLGPSISDASASIVQLDGSIGISTWVPATECVGPSWSGVRRLPSWQGASASALVDGSTGASAVLQVQPSSFSACGDAGTNFVITTTYGAAPGTTAASFGPYALTNVAPVTGVLGQPSLHQIAGTLPAAPSGCYDAGPDSSLTVSVNSPTSPVVCAGCVMSVGAVAPTFANISPNECLASGGDNVWITGTGFLSGMTMSVGANTGSACTVLSTTSAACPCPAFTSANGTSTLQSVTLTTSGASASSTSSAATKVTFIPTNSTIKRWVSGDEPQGTSSGAGVGIVLSGGNVTSWLDMSASASNWAQATSADGPTVTANFNSSGLPALTFNGSSQFMTATANITAAPIVQCVVLKLPSTISSTIGIQELDQGISSKIPELILTSSNTLNAYDGTTLIGTTVVPSATIYACMSMNTTSSFVQAGTTTASGTLVSPLSFSGTDWLAVLGGGGSGYLAGTIAESIVLQGSSSTIAADVATIHTAWCGASGGAGRWLCAN